MSRVSRPLSRLLLGALPVAAVLLAAPPGASAAKDLSCGDQSIGRTRCSRVVVPLDRTGAVPGEVGLSVRTIQRGQRRKKVRREAVLFLAGGPGQAATTLVADYAKPLAPLLRRRDLMAVDTRGVGRATDLIVCPELETSAITGLSAPESFRSCARRLGPAVDRYGTEDVVADLEAARIASGYDRLLLVGVSYGTYTAQRYAAAHPDRVSGLVLDSTVDPTGEDPFSTATYRALPRALQNACVRGACRGVSSDVAGDLARTRDRLPLVTAIDDGTGRRRPARIDAPTLISLIQAGDIDPLLRAALPAALHRAAQGDPAPLGRLTREVGLLAVPQDDEDPASGPAAAASVSTGSFVATICRDTHQPWAPGTLPGEARRQAALGVLAARSPSARGGWSAADLVDLTPAGICADWPGTPDDLPVGPAPDVPTLLLSGQDDTRTSPEEARRVAGRHPGTQLLSVPGQGHSVLGVGRGCVTGALQAFSAGKPIGTCRRPSKVLRAEPLAPESAAALGRTPTARARAVATATVLDALRSVLLASYSGDDVLEILLGERDPVRIAGLRSGYAVLESDGDLRLHRLGYVPDTAVTTLDGDRRRIRVSVRGRGLRAGTYTIRNPLADAALLQRVLGIAPEDVEEISPRLARVVEALAGR